MNNYKIYFTIRLYYKIYYKNTLGSSPNVTNFCSDTKVLAVLMISLHFFGVSSTLPAKSKQQQAVT